MNSKADVIAVSTERPAYPQEKSRYFGSVKKEKLRLVFSFYSPDGNEIAMPIASMSAYLKRDFPNVEVLLEPVLILRDAEEYSPQNYAKKIEALQPDLIAFSIMTPHWYPMEPYFEELKKSMPNLPLCIGGYQAMLSQDQTMENPNVDYICVGDGEYAIGNIVQHLRGTKDGPVDGMWEKLIDGSIYESEPHQIGDLEALPFPDYDIFAKEDGFNDVNSSIFGPQGKLVLPVMTGRGCPYKCTYCCNTPILEGWKTKKTFLRKYQPDAMVDELIRLRDEYNVGYFEFWDELFLSNLKFVRAFFEIYKEKIGLPFSINSRVEVMNEEFCKTAAEAGCHTIWFGIESGDEEFRAKRLGRKMKNQQVIDAAANCKKAGINRLTFNIVGMPLETAENMRQTLALNKAIAPEHFFFFPYIPLRGTPLYNTAKEEGLLLTHKRNLHYLSAANDRQFIMNMKEQPELLTQDEYNEICMEMLAFQEANNRLTYDEQGGGEAAETATVEDKSFSLVADDEVAADANEDERQIDNSVVAKNQEGGLMDSVRNLFRS
jgi:anaerobic magnesium-protoporphyrin IX monomethyl ester cyclase